MGYGSIDVAMVAVAAATLLSISCTWPQVARIGRTGDIAGVSVTAAALTVSSEIGWTVYLAGESLWSAVPEGVFNIGANALLVVAVRRAGGTARIAVLVAVAWVITLLTARWLGGPGAIAALLGLAYVIQLTPAVVTAWRTWSPSGIATSTWAMRLVESVLWGVYGFLRGDPPLIVFGILGVTESTAILVRKVTTRHRPAMVSAAVPSPLVVRSEFLDDAMVG
jgi:uncharacterized protein with PQ loop repeat